MENKIEISLGEFERRHNVNKSTVSRLARDAGFDTSEGLTSEAYAYLRQHYGLAEWSASDVAKANPTASVDVVPTNFIQSSALVVSQSSGISLPETFDATAMAQFFDGAVGESKDTTRILQIADLAISAAEQSMDQKVAQQRAELHQAEKHAQALNNRVLEAKSRMHAKSAESRMLAERQTQVVHSAEEQLQSLLALGKPQGNQPSSP